MHHMPDFKSRPPLTLRALFMMAAVIGGLMLPAVPAFSSDRPSRSGGEADTPRAAASICKLMLRSDAPVGGRSAAVHYRENLMPMAIIGMITGVNHVTGPREKAAAFLPADSNAALDGRNARAIAAYRKCRADATLRALSN